MGSRGGHDSCWFRIQRSRCSTSECCSFLSYAWRSWERNYALVLRWWRWGRISASSFRCSWNRSSLLWGIVYQGVEKWNKNSISITYWVFYLKQIEGIWFYFLFKSVSLKNSWTNASASLGEDSLSFPQVIRCELSNVVFIFFKSPMVALICWTISQQ